MNQNPLKIALIGYGKMGRLIDAIASETGVLVVARVDPKEGLEGFDALSASKVDVCIDFSHPEAVLSNTTMLAEKGINIVMGTTGWEKDQEQVNKILTNSEIGFIYAPNFSIGVSLYIKVLEEIATLMNNHTQYDVAANESHHNQKVDIPSGTAKTIAETLVDKLDRKKRALYSNDPTPVKAEDLHVSSLRCGNIPGTHTVTFDSPFDSISLTHTARNREGFARGALEAALWLRGKRGIFSLKDML